MRVLQLGPYPPPHGGVQSNLVAIQTYLRRQDISCAVINITRNRQVDADDVYYPENAVQLLGLLLRLKYDVLHLHLGGMLSRRLLSLGLVCTLQPGSTSVMTFHSGGYPSTPEAQATGPNSFAGFVLRRFKGLIGVNPEILNFFHKLGVPPERTRLIYPHAFLTQEAPSGPLPEPLQSFFTQHNPVLISVGLLEPEYDLPLQIEAIGQVRKKFPKAGLIMIGSGSLEQELRRRIAAQPDASHILLSGDVPHAATMQAISQASVMLRTTLYDGDAVSVREALHLGTPVIATDNGMRPAGVCLIPKSNMPAVLLAIEKQLMLPPLHRTSSAPDESNLNAVLALYRHLLQERRARPPD
jgi:glycosyltransferase involved in cell wall biosynthesis